MKKIVWSVILTLCITMTTVSVNAATKEELQKSYEQTLKRLEDVNSEISQLEAEAEPIRQKLKQFDTVSMLFAKVIALRPYLLVKSGAGPLGMFTAVENYYVIKNARITFEEEMGIHSGEYIPVGQMPVTIDGRYYTATVLDKTPEEFNQLSKTLGKVVKQIEKLKSDKTRLGYKSELLEKEIENAGKYPSNWAQEEVESADSMGLLPEELKIDYQEYITREDFAKLVVRMISRLGSLNGSMEEVLKVDGITLPEVSPFTDTNDRNILIAHAYGIVNGNGSGKFMPKNKITREEAATMLLRLLRSRKIQEIKYQEADFEDFNEVSAWAKENVKSIAAIYGGNKAIMSGSEGKFYPKKFYTREQAFLTMNRLYLYASRVVAREEEQQVDSSEERSNEGIIGNYFLMTEDNSAMLVELGMTQGTYHVLITDRDYRLEATELTVSENRLEGVFIDSDGNKGRIILEKFRENEIMKTFELTTIIEVHKSLRVPNVEREEVSTIAG